MAIEPKRISFRGAHGTEEATVFGAGDLVVGIAPALGLHARYYEPLARALAGAGLCAVTFDLPGQGGSPVRASWQHDWGYAEAVRHLAALRQAAGGTRFVWLGHSIGGQLALMDAAHVDGVVLVASGPPYFRVWSGIERLRYLALTQLSAGIASVLGYYPGEQLGFGGREGRTLIRDWARAARTGRYHFDGLDGDAAIERVTAPVHAVYVEGDQLAPQAAVEHTLAKLRRARVSRATWPRAEQPPELRANPHNRWPRTPSFVVNEVGAFLEREHLASPRAEGASR